MDNRRYFRENSQNKLAYVGHLALMVFLVSALSALVSAKAADRSGWSDWPEQSRADIENTITYIFGGFGFVNHEGSEEGAFSYRGFTGELTAEGDLLSRNAALDDDDYSVSAGFGVRLGGDWHAEAELIVLNGPYDSPNVGGDVKSRPDEPALALSIMKGFKVGPGPPLLRYTARIGLAEIDDPYTEEDAPFYGFGVSHEPWRLEYRVYDFDVFESEVLSLTYLYDF